MCLVFRYLLIHEKQLMKNRKKILLRLLGTLCIVCCFAGCNDGTPSMYKEVTPYDPSKPVVFNDFSPKKGALRTRMYITGSNFGTDVSKIHIYIGGAKAETIGSTGTTLYCMVPPRAFDGSVKVVIDNINGEPAVEHVFDESFEYEAKNAVGTLCGFKDEYGNSAIVNGGFDVAQFSYPVWLIMDTLGNGNRDLLVVELSNSVRKIDLINQEVSTVITQGNATMKNLQTVTLRGDSLLLVDDNAVGDLNGGRNVANIYYTLREENFRKAQPYNYDRCAYACMVHPKDGGVYYTTYHDLVFIKKDGQWNEDTQSYEPKDLFTLGGSGGVEVFSDKAYPIIHPSGKYAYILLYESIWKTEYNEETHEFMPAEQFVGKKLSGGDVDGVGTDARFKRIGQGVFVKNKDYVAAGREDVYDFYVTDIDNHSIRRVTPDGRVTTYAGKGSPFVDGNKGGDIDGELRTEARFNWPFGIAYDERTETFYVCETGNKKIRTISVQ